MTESDVRLPEIVQVSETKIKFEGRNYTKNREGYYYSSDGTHTHLSRDVWTSLNGLIPEGHEIHHRDFNRSNNSHENLQCVTIDEHRNLHWKKRHTEPLIKICAWCSKEFQTTQPKTKCCSEVCSHKYGYQTNKKARREHHAEYYQSHKKQLQEKASVYYQSHKIQHIEYNKKYVDLHEEQIREYKRQWGIAHKDEINARRRAAFKAKKESPA